MPDVVLQKASMEGEEKKTTGIPTLSQTSNWSVSDFIRNVLGKLCQGSAQTWVTVLKARLKIAQTSLCAVYVVMGSTATGTSVWENENWEEGRKSWLQNFCFF